MKPKARSNRVKPHTMALLGCLFLAAGAYGQTATTSSVPNATTEAVDRQLEDAYLKIHQAHQDDPAMTEFGQRVALVEEVSDVLLKRFAAIRSASMQTLLADAKRIGTPAAGTIKSPRQALAPGQTATELLEKYAERFGQPLPKPSVTQEDLETLKRFYAQKAAAAGIQIAEKGRAASAAREDVAETILQLCLVMPMLHVPDENWSQDQVEMLPAWMKTPDNLAKVELFCLRIKRPFSGYQFFVHAQRQRQGEQAQKIDYLTYLTRTTRRMLDDQEFPACFYCGKAGMVLAEKEAKPEAGAAIRLLVARALEKTGHPDMAAEEMKAILAGRTDEDDWGQAAVLRLKLLYQANNFAGTVEEAEKYQAEPRAKRYLPQILYIRWVSLRRQNKQSAAEDAEKAFLKNYAQHPLAADIYFAQAMTALAAGDYAAATRLLETVEERFPKSPLAARAKTIRERLNDPSKH